MSDVPKEIGRGTMKIGPIELEVVNLDNGQRLITAESLNKFLDYIDMPNLIDRKAEEPK